MHYHEQHGGKWQDCEKCAGEVPTEMYVWYGTNEYNFEVLQNPPEYEPTHCAKCARVIRLAEEGYLMTKDGYVCEDCSDIGLPDLTQ